MLGKIDGRDAKKANRFPAYRVSRNYVVVDRYGQRCRLNKALNSRSRASKEVQTLLEGIDMRRTT